MRNYSLLALAAGLLGMASANAAVTYAAGDLIMSFRATTTGSQGFGTTYVVNVGQASAFRDASVSGDLNLGNISADLSSLFGAGWAARTDILWGVAGTPSNSITVAGDDAGTLYASRPQNTPGVPGTGWVVAGSSARLTVSTNMSTAQDMFKTMDPTANSARAAFMGEGLANDWREFLATGGNPAYTSGSQDFGAFSNIEGTLDQRLSLFRVNSGSAGSYEGSFTISPTGVVNFVPEPSTAILGALGTSLLAFRRRRRGA